MLVKFPHFDNNCFHVLGSLRTPPSTGLPVSPVDQVELKNKKHREQRVLECPSGELKSFGGVPSQSLERTGIIHEPVLKKQSLVKSPDRKQRGSTRDSGRIVKKRDFEVEFKWGTENGLLEKVHTRCSTKWISYGGCIPAILQALDTVPDLDEALRPWEDKIGKKERSIILKEQRSWERALEIFQWFKRKGYYELNVIHYNIMLRILGKAHKWSHVESLWDEMNVKGIAPINSTYGTLIDVCSKGGHKEEALRWLERMNKQGMEPDEVTMGTVIQLYKKAGEFQKAEDFFKKWSFSEVLRHESMTAISTADLGSALHSHAGLSSHTYNALIDTFGKAGQLKDASQTFAQMLKEGIAPNTVTFNTMIHICGNHGQLDEVVSLIHKMEELRCPLDTRTYNILIFLHARHDDINMAANYFAKMKEACLEPDVVSYRTLLYAYSIRHMVQQAEDLVSEMDGRGLEIDEYTQSALTRMYIEAGMLEKSWLWFRRFHLAGNMSSECYSANIDAYGERGHILEAEKVFICCQEEKKPSVIQFNVMIKAYGIGKCYDKACQLFDSMASYGVFPDKCSYSSLIQILVSVDMPHIARPYLRRMQQAGLVSDCVPYCSLLSGFAKLGQLEMAEELYEEMIRFDVHPDVIVYGVLINAFANVGGAKEALCYVDAMKKAGLPGNTVIYNSLIKLYTKVGYLKDAEETYKMLQSLEEGPSVYSSNCMIDLYSERSMVKQAEDIFNSLQRKGNANEFTFAMILCLYKRIGRIEEAIRIAKQMRELGLLTDLLSYNNVLGLYAMDGRSKEAVEVFNEMTKAAIQPNNCTFKLLGVLLVKCGVPKQAVGKLEVTMKRDAQSGLQAWMSTLSSMVGLDDHDI
ncbi:hypothetical protein CJ030_MR3G014507 [Morella rubra]|uniref:Uncharacterized protein n=1 Tax=Morella rubra TaxID=262757 RepID=A0A6A1VZF0_9ROSI|nr:hypothetical protein CJ030_MR3G014507 [Morella rubra]